jgi:hypothetical protein
MATIPRHCGWTFSLSGGRRGLARQQTVNNILTVLGNTLRVAVRWKVIAAMPCSINLIARGELPGVRRLGRAVRIHRDAVLGWLAQGQGHVSRSRSHR